MDHKNSHISTNIQRQKLSIALFEPASWDPSHGGLARTILSTKRSPTSKENTGGAPLGKGFSHSAPGPGSPLYIYIHIYIYVYMAGILLFSVPEGIAKSTFMISSQGVHNCSLAQVGLAEGVRTPPRCHTADTSAVPHSRTGLLCRAPDMSAVSHSRTCLLCHVADMWQPSVVRARTFLRR